jgi:hypothetical protein
VGRSALGDKAPTSARVNQKNADPPIEDRRNLLSLPVIRGGGGDLVFAILSRADEAFHSVINSQGVFSDHAVAIELGAKRRD